MRKILLICIFYNFIFANVDVISNFIGDVEILRNLKSNKVVSKNYELFKNDKIITKSNAKAQIKFIDDTFLTIGKNSIIEINEYLINGANSNMKLKAKKGSYDLISEKISKSARNKFSFQATTATIEISDARFSEDVAKGEVECSSGEINVNVGGKNHILKKGERLQYKNL